MLQSTSTVFTTITPDPTTVSTSTSYVYTTTVTVTTSSDAAVPGKIKRATTPAAVVVNQPSQLPTYISTQCGAAATASSRYSSACSCYGVRPSTSTLPASTTVVTSTSTAVAPTTTVTTTISTATTVITTTTSQAPKVSSSADCSTGKSGYMFADDGRRYYVACNTYFLSSNLDDVVQVKDLQECINTCETYEPYECRVANFYRSDPSGDKRCELHESVISGYDNVGMDVTYPVQTAHTVLAFLVRGGSPKQYEILPTVSSFVHCGDAE